jgi:hypothetical protein
MKKINPKRRVRTPKKPKRLVRSYWLVKVTGEAQHCLWSGRLECGVPPIASIAKLIDVPKGYVERVHVMYKGKRYSMFVDENGKRRTVPILNWKASAVFANATMVSNGLGAAVYNDLLEDPVMHPAMLISNGLVIVGDAVLWEGEFSERAGSEDAMPSIMEKLSVKI